MVTLAATNETDAEARGQTADNGQQGHDRTAEGGPKEPTASDRSIRGVLHSLARTVHNEKPIPGPDADRVDFAGSFGIPPEVFDCVALPVYVDLKEWKASATNIIMREVSSRDVRNADVLRDGRVLVIGVHGQPRERQPYGYAFMSPYPLAV